MMTKPCQKRAASLFLRALWILLILAAAAAPPIARADNAQYFYDPGGRLIGMIDPTNGSAKYSYDAAGNITSITRTASTTMGVVQFFPMTGPVGTSVTISGTAFTGGTTTVKFGTVTATPTSVTANQIVVPVPSGVTGAVAIQISRTSPSGSFTTPTNFNVASAPAAPTVTSFSPGTQAQGSSVTITGTNFDTANSKVFVNGQAAQVTAATSTTLTINVPPSSSGKIVVETPAGSATSSIDLIIPSPTFAPGAVFSSARTTIGASPLSTTTGASGTVSLILFDVSAAQGVSFHLNHSGFPGCPKIWLLGPSGSILYYNSGSCSADVWFAAAAQATPGTYSIGLAPASTAGTFTTTLFSVPADATATAAVNGVTTPLTIGTSGQHGVVTFVNSVAGQKVTMDVNSNIDSYYALTIQNPDGSYLLSSPTTDYGNLWINGSSFLLTQTGTYTISVSPTVVGGTDSGTGSLYTTIFAVPADATGTTAIDGTTSTLTLTTPGQYGSVTFTNSVVDKKVTMDLDSNIVNNVTYTIKNPDGTFLLPATVKGYGNYWVNGAPFLLHQTGTYTITVTTVLQSGTNTGTGPLYTTIFPVPADATGTVAIDGTTSTLTLSTPGQYGSVTFTNSVVDKKVTMDLDSNIVNNVTYTIKNPDGTFLLPATGQGYGNYWVSGAPFLLHQTGTYTITVTTVLQSNTNTGTGPLYTTIFAVPADATGTTAIDGTTSTLTLTTPGQYGSVTFTNSVVDRKVTMDLDSNIVNNVTYTIKNPDGTFLLPATVKGYGNYWVNGAPFLLHQTGTYTITVTTVLQSGTNTGTGPLYTTIFPVPADAIQALTIGGSAMTLTLTTPGQKGEFDFPNATAGQHVKVSLSSYTITTCVGLSVLNPDGTTLMGSTNVCGSYTSSALTLSQTGTYKMVLVPVLSGAIPAGTGSVAGSVALSP